MLRRLSIRDILLIDRLDLEFDAGLAVLTGETGAGKSILLDSLGLVLGARGDARFVRPTVEKASVTAVFDPPDAASGRLLAEAGVEGLEDDLLIRRVVGADGRGRAYVNDQPVTVGLLRRLGESLVEVNGQFERHGLVNPATHRDILDQFGGLGSRRAAVAGLYRDWRAAAAETARLGAAMAEAEAGRAQLADLLATLDELAPEPGETAVLAARRELLRQTEQLTRAFNLADTMLDKGQEGGALGLVNRAIRSLAGFGGAAGELAGPALAALERAGVELEEALQLVQTASANLDADPSALEQAEARLFALRGLARRLGCAPEALADHHVQLRARLRDMETDGDRLTASARATEAARRAYLGLAEQLHRDRQAAAVALERAVAAELPDLRLAGARLTVRFSRLAEEAWHEGGIDRLFFEARTNPGMALGPLHKIASGGELGRFLLALKVVLAAAVETPTLVFDEVDAGAGGAAAAAIGGRLARLGENRQVLAVTHSPQVAALATRHFRVQKHASASETVTEVTELPAGDRQEEIARMLSGSLITREARAAAARLLNGHG